MKMYAPGDEIWFDTVGIHAIPLWRTKQKYYHGRVLRPEMDASKHGYNYWVDIGFGESVLVHDWNILTREPYYDNDFIKDVREEYKNESKKIKDEVIDRIRKFVKYGNNFMEGFQMGIGNWCKESNHVFEIGEYAEVIKNCDIRGCVVKIVDVKYNECGEHVYWVQRQGYKQDVHKFKQNDIEQTNKTWPKEDNIMGYYKKTDIHDGMLVITRGGDRFFVMSSASGGHYFVNESEAIPLYHYDDNLKTKDMTRTDAMDIMEIWSKPRECKKISTMFDPDDEVKSIFGTYFNNREIVWERSEVKEMTVAEIEKALGYSIKVVK